MNQLWKSVDDVFDFAMAEERKAVWLYRSFARQAPSASLKALFEGLVAEEIGHFRKLAKMRGATEASLAASGLAALPRPRAEKAPSSAITDVASAYRFAIRAERGAAALYATFAQMAGDATVRATFEQLAEEELGHKATLEADLKKRQPKGGFLKRFFRFIAEP